MRPEMPPRPTLTAGLMPEAALAQDGVFTRRQARVGGFPDAKQRRLLRAGVWLPLTGGVLRPAELTVGPWQRARAVALLGRVVSHSTAGALWGLTADETLHGLRTHGRRSTQLVDHRMDLRPGDVVDLHGMPVTSPLRTLVDLLSAIPHEEAIGLVTDAFRRRVLTSADLVAAVEAARGRIGVRRIRQLALSCSGEPWSWLEWRFQQAARRLAPGWRFNVRIELPGGSVVIVDALHEPTKTVVELDGRRFHGPDRFQADRTRDQRLAAAGFLTVRITSEDLDERFTAVIAGLGETIAVRTPRAA